MPSEILNSLSFGDAPPKFAMSCITLLPCMVEEQGGCAASSNGRAAAAMDVLRTIKLQARSDLLPANGTKKPAPVLPRAGSSRSSNHTPAERMAAADGKQEKSSCRQV